MAPEMPGAATLAFAGTCVLLAAACAVAVRTFAPYGGRRWLAYAACPASQLAVVAAAALLAREGTIPVGWSVAATLCGAACAVYDAALVRALDAGERASLEHERVRALAEQLEAQRAYEAERRSFSQDCQAAYALAADRLEAVAASLEREGAAPRPLAAELAELDAPEGVWCANEALYAMLSFKERAVRMYGGELDAWVMLPRLTGVTDVELCALVSNAVDALLPALGHGGSAVHLSLRCAHGYLCLEAAVPGCEATLPDHRPLCVLKGFAARYEGDVRCLWEDGGLTLSVLVRS